MKAILASFMLVLPLSAAGQNGDWTPLFLKDGPPAGFVSRHWADIGKPAGPNATWEVKDGVLMSTGDRGCWLISEKKYRDFEIEYEFKLGPRGNSGLALRAPMSGDPAFDGLEMQMSDLRYFPEAKESELTGGLYRALPPIKQVYKPEEWNRARVRLQGTRVQVELNGELIQDTDLAQQETPVARHDGSSAPPLKDRPREGHIGFQELSRDGGHVMIRGARIREITPAK